MIDALLIPCAACFIVGWMCGVEAHCKKVTRMIQLALEDAAKAGYLKEPQDQ